MVPVVPGGQRFVAARGDARRTHFLYDLHPIAFDRSGADFEHFADRRAGVPRDDKIEDLHITSDRPVKPKRY